jgi:hypothetical protein
MISSSLLAGTYYLGGNASLTDFEMLILPKPLLDLSPCRKVSVSASLRGVPHGNHLTAQSQESFFGVVTQKVGFRTLSLSCKLNICGHLL